MSMSTRRMPRANRAGCTVAPWGENTPPLKVGESIRARICSPDSTSKSSARPSRSAVTMRSPHAPTWATDAAALMSPSGRNQASIPWSSQNAPIARTLSSPASHSATAARSPNSWVRCGQPRPEAADEPTVATAGAAAADVLFQDDHVGAGIELLQVEGGPHAGVAPAQDHDVGRGVLGERGCGFAGELGQAPGLR